MFRTGEFSHLAGVSKRLLQFYDELGLLKPAHLDPQTGYRYYSAQQLPRLNRILALKELGFALDQISTLLQAEISDEAIEGMLLLKKAEAERMAQEELQRLRRIEARLQQNRLGEAGLDVVVKSIPAQRILSVQAILPAPDDLFHLLRLLQQARLSTIDQRTLGPLAGVVYTDRFTYRNNDIELGYLLKKAVQVHQDPLALTEAYELRMHELPAVQTMATAVQTGGPDLIFAALGRIGHWIEATGYRIAGPFREIGLDLPTSGRFDDMVIEVQMPIEPQTTAPDRLRTQPEQRSTPPETPPERIA
jgi:DNA-binding transcriptional MerR regulator